MTIQRHKLYYIMHQTSVKGEEGCVCVCACGVRACVYVHVVRAHARVCVQLQELTNQYLFLAVSLSTASLSY